MTLLALVVLVAGVALYEALIVWLWLHDGSHHDDYAMRFRGPDARGQE